MIRLFRRRPEPEPPWYPGIRLRISTRDGVIVDAGSDHLYYSAKYGGPEPCTPACLPGCEKHGWLNLVAGGGSLGMLSPVTQEFSQVPLKIEIRPVRLGDPTSA
jgi:hypothetical protein